MKALLSIALALLAFNTPLLLANSQAEKTPEDGISTASYDDEASTCMYTNLEIGINETDGAYVEAALKNTFTLFSSVVSVDLWLYSSLTKTTDLSKMTFEGKVRCDDLNMGETLTITASTHNEDRYWIAYAIYYKSSGNQYYQTDPAFFYADGTYNPAF